MPRRLLIPLLLAATVAGTVAHAQDRLPDSLRLRVDQVFADWDHTNTPGCALGISERGRVVYERGYGMADLQNGLAITPSSIFHVASVSKQFAAFAIGLLADDGRLSLDDDVRTYVPEIPNYGSRITVRQLIHHVSGLRDQWQLLGYAGWREDDLITEQDVLDIVSRQKGVNFAPGAEWVYSNTGYTLLAVIVKRVSGKSLRQFAQERIFQPLGMHSTHFHDDHTMIVPGRTSAYQPRPEGGWFISIPVFDTYGATSLFTTSGDLLTWMAQLDARGVGSAKLLEAIQTSAVLNDGTPAKYGFGLTLGTYRSLRTVGHGGADAGYRAQVTRYPERGIAVAVLCNASNSGPGVLARRVADVLLGTSVPVEPALVDTVARPITPEARARWVGTYHDAISHLELRIRQNGETLLLGDGARLMLSSDTTAFLDAGGRAGLTLRTDGGTVQGLTRLPRTTRDLYYRREAPYAPDRASLTAFTGEYFSDELDVRYRVVVGDSGLVVRARRMDDLTLDPAWEDAFTTKSGSVLEFTRTGKRVGGFTLSDGRVRGVKFVRVGGGG
jgi:CubicO group peptidase (beta-lactamase class C family)